MKLKIKNKEIQELLTDGEFDYPTYTTQVMNIACQNAKATSPQVVGKMSDLIQEFDGRNIHDWEVWYKKKYPHSINKATTRVVEMIQKKKASINLIDEKMIRQWVEELVI